ncbi:hypothetical protein [Marinimicrobium locisalis]|uniref:hypothetical protein n=1 Tax=Marinimicrobium locisalis TaxID=546022 RepID=UPI0032216A15
MGEFHGNLDYLLWLSAHEEATFQECLYDYRQEWPAAELSRTLAELQEGLLAFLKSGNIGLYAEQLGRPKARELVPVKGYIDFMSAREGTFYLNFQQETEVDSGDLTGQIVNIQGATSNAKPLRIRRHTQRQQTELECTISSALFPQTLVKEKRECQNQIF